jgi:hypothetical protein
LPISHSDEKFASNSDGRGEAISGRRIDPNDASAVLRRLTPASSTSPVVHFAPSGLAGLIQRPATCVKYPFFTAHANKRAFAMSDVGKMLMLLGLAIAVIGALVWGLGRVGFRGLPGDISYQGQNVRFYFPIASSIVLSIVLTLLLWLWRWWTGGK